MLFKPSVNSIIAELTLTHRGRAYNLADLKSVSLNGTTKNCIWCLAELEGKKYKWCSEECVVYALTWARPQTAYGLYVLLEKQENLCAICHTSWQSPFDTALVKAKRYPGATLSTFIERFMRAFKRLIPDEVRPEIDHVVPIHLNGTALGLENHRILCRPCHRVKTSAELRAKFKKHGSPLKGLKRSEASRAAMSKARKGFDSEARKVHRPAMYENAKLPIIAINIKTLEEREFSSIIEAATVLDLQACNISRVLSGSQNRTQHKGWKFKLK